MSMNNSSITKWRIKDYLDPPSSGLDEYQLSDKCLSKHAEVLDIVTPESTGSCCFTKSYGRYVEGTGSVLQVAGDLDDVYVRARAASGEEEAVSVLRELGLRHFTPTEVSRLMGFGDSTFSFPPEYMADNKLHCYRVLGNSLNVHVVAFLADILFNR